MDTEPSQCMWEQVVRGTLSITFIIMDLFQELLVTAQSVVLGMDTPVLVATGSGREATTLSMPGRSPMKEAR